MSTVMLSQPHCAITSAEKPDGIASQPLTHALPAASRALSLFAIWVFPPRQREAHARRGTWGRQRGDGALTIAAHSAARLCDEHGSALQPAGAQVVQRLICLLQLVGQRTRLHRHLRGEGKKFLTVGTGQVGDRAHDALAPEDVVGEAGDWAHVDASAYDDAAALDCPQCRRNQRSYGGEDDRGIEQFRRRLVRAAGPYRAKLARE